MFFTKLFDKPNLVAAHRGVSSLRAENTMAAFRKALGRNDFVELDVGFSRDGEAIIIHDSTLLRTSDVINHGQFQPPYEVTDYDLSELKTLDFSSWFAEGDPFGTIKSGKVSLEELQRLPVERIPTLKETLSFLKETGMPVNIEIKDMSGTEFDSIAAEKVVDIIHEFQYQDSVVISSFNHGYLKQCKQLAPEITTGVLVENNHPENLIEYLHSLKADAYHADYTMLDKQLVDKLRNAGFTVNAYTVNGLEDMNRMFDMGVCAIFSDMLEMIQ